MSNSRVRRREQGGNNYSVGYSRVWNNLLIDAGFNRHDAAMSDFAVVTTSRATPSPIRRAAVRTLADEQLGGFGQDFPETRPTVQARGSAQYQMETVTR